MKKILFLSMIICAVIVNCTQKAKESEKVVKIENTIKSISLWSDSIKIEPSALLLSFERINKAIDSLGYPDAGYKLWLIQSDTNKNFRFMVEGSWPNQAIYDTIHNHELYKNTMKAEEKLFSGLKVVSYNRFTIVK
jgi:hypothetical protein